MEYPTISFNEIKILIPSGVIVSGPSSSGKTNLVLKILKYANELFLPPPKKIGIFKIKINKLYFICSLVLWGIFRFNS